MFRGKERLIIKNMAFFPIVIRKLKEYNIYIRNIVILFKFYPKISLQTSKILIDDRPTHFWPGNLQAMYINPLLVLTGAYLSYIHSSTFSVGL